MKLHMPVRAMLISLLMCAGGLVGAVFPVVSEHAAEAATTYPYCPFVPSSYCGVLITVAPNGSLMFNHDPNHLFTDGDDDPAYGIINTASSAVASIKLSGANIFALDGDERVNPHATVTPETPNLGTVAFSPPLGPFGSGPGSITWFVLESYTSGTTGTATFLPTITNLPSPAVNGGSFTPNVSTNSNGATSVATSTPSVCSVSGSVVKFVGVGPCTLTASVAESATYAAATGASQAFSVTPGAQTVSITSTAPTGATYSGANTQTYSVVASASSGLPVVLTIDSSSTSGCTISGTVVSYGGGVGTCIVDANEPAGGGYSAATQVQQSFSISPATQTVSITSAAPNGATYSGANNQTYGVVASASSGRAVVLTIDSSSTSGCTISGTVVSFGGGVGTCIVDANEPASTDYTAATQVQQSFSVSPAAQTVSITSAAPNGATYSGANNQTYSVIASASSGLPVVLTIDSSSTSGCTISGTVVSFGGGVGTCIVDANEPASSGYNAAIQVQQSFSVSKAPTTVSVSFSPSAAVGSPVTVTATVAPTNSSLTFDNHGTVTFSGSGASVGPITLCSAAVNVAGGKASCTFTPTAADTYTVVATYSGDTLFGGVSGTGADSIATTMITCGSGSTCTGTVTTPNEDLSATSSSKTGSIDVSVNPTAPSSFSCGDPFRHAPQWTVVSDVNLGGSIVFTVTFPNSAAAGFFLIPFAVCYDSPNSTFTDLYLQKVHVGLLPLCALTPAPQSSLGPCVESISESLFGTGNVTETVVIPAGDPTFH